MSDNRDNKLSTKLQELIEKAYMPDIEDARASGRVGYVARLLTQATMLQSKPKDNEFELRNSDFCLTMFAPKKSACLTARCRA